MYSIYQKLLDEKGLKNADVSRATKISNMTLSDWKNGKSTPKQDKLLKIADFLGVSVEYLMTGKEPLIESLYSDENSELLLKVHTRINHDEDFKRSLISLMSGIDSVKKYYNLSNDDKNTVDNMIEFLYNKKHEK